MASYKVLQDIEAEDKLVGPLTLRQFIYAAIAVVSGFIAFKLVSVSIFFVIPFVPIVALFGVLAAPFGHDQPGEVWLLARVRFFLLPHKRIWNQSGATNLVTITAPKKATVNLTKNMSQTEVNSRLQALANTIDSRGWAIKNVNVNLNDQNYSNQLRSDSDRLTGPIQEPMDVPITDVTAADDMMDATSNLTAQHLDQMIVNAEQQHHQQIVEKMNSDPTEQPAPKDNTDYWFMHQGDNSQSIQPANGYSRFGDDAVVLPGEDPTKYSPSTSSDVEGALLNELAEHKKFSQNVNGHMHVIPVPGQDLPHSSQHGQSRVSDSPTADSSTLDQAGDSNNQTPTTNPAIINLALANKDNWTVATTAREAEKAQQKQSPQDEVIVSLH